MAKKLSAAMKKQISETLKKRWAEKKARLAAKPASTLSVEQTGDRALYIRGGRDGDTARLSWNAPATSSPRSSRDEAVQLAADIVDIVSDEASPLSLVRVVDRILRP